MPVGQELRDVVFSVLHAPPSEHGFNRTSWRLRDLRRAVESRGIRASASNISAAIKQAGYRWRSARTSLTSTDPEYRQKVDALRATLGSLQDDEAFFSIDEFGPFAIRTRGGVALQALGQLRSIPQWQTSKGSLILTAALELATNQVTHFYSDRKNGTESIKLIEILRREYADMRRIWLSWDAAPWHSSEAARGRIEFLNGWAEHDGAPRIELQPLPSRAQFLNVIESVFSGMASAVIHNSDYANTEAAKASISRYLEDRNAHFRQHPRKAGRSVWGKEISQPQFSESNNCKDPKYQYR